MADEAEIFRLMNAEIGMGLSRWQNRPPAYQIGTNWSEINPLTYQGQMPTNYGTIMGESSGRYDAQILFGANTGSVSRNIVDNGFGLAGCHIDTSAQLRYQQEMQAKAAKENEKEKGTGSYTYTINEKGEITYKKPDGSSCTVTEFQREAGMSVYRKAAQEAKAKKEKA